MMGETPGFTQVQAPQWRRPTSYNLHYSKAIADITSTYARLRGLMSVPLGFPPSGFIQTAGQTYRGRSQPSNDLNLSWMATTYVFCSMLEHTWAIVQMTALILRPCFNLLGRPTNLGRPTRPALSQCWMIPHLGYPQQRWFLTISTR